MACCTLRDAAEAAEPESVPGFHAQVERLLRNGAHAFLEDSDEAARVRAAPHRAACT
jgi:hypothetical protein